jgi:hypothetical protein
MIGNYVLIQVQPPTGQRYSNYFSLELRHGVGRYKMQRMKKKNLGFAEREMQQRYKEETEQKAT